MRVYLGKKLKNKYEEVSRDTILHSSPDFFVSADLLPTLTLQINQNQHLFLWGRIHAIQNRDGSLAQFESTGNGLELLKNLVQENNVSTVISKIEGHYVGVIINSKSEITIFADSYHRKDIFYAYRDNCLIASTNLDPVIEAFPHTQYNQTALACVFTIYGVSPPKKQTIYENVYRLGIGERIEYRSGQFKILSEPFKPTQIEQYNESHLYEYSDLLESAIKIRSSKSCNWIYMSSGWDSSSILAILAKINGPGKIRPVIGRVIYSDKSGVINNFEIERAQKIVDYFSLPLDIIEIDYRGRDFLDSMNEIKHDLKNNHVFLPYSYFYKKMAEFIAKQGAQSDAIFNGEISDGAHNLGFSQFATILEHPDLGFREYSDKMAAYLYGPSFFNSLLENKHGTDFVYNGLCLRSGADFYDAHSMNDHDKKTKYIESFFLSLQRIPLINLSKNAVLTDRGFDEFESTMCETYFQEFADMATPDSLYSWILHLYNSFHWQGGNIKVFTNGHDRHDMQVSIPFWDTRLQSFLSSMPEYWGRGLDLNPTKYPLKWMLKNRVDYPNHLQVGPHSYLYDVNPDWNVYSDLIYGSGAKSYFKEILCDYRYENLFKESHFDLAYLKKLTDDYCNDVEVDGVARSNLFALIGLSLVGWY